MPPFLLQSKQIHELNAALLRSKREEKHRAILLAEVNHRSRNLLAVVQAIASQTVRISDPAEFAERFAGRLRGLGVNQNLLIDNDWLFVELGALLAGQLAPFGGPDTMRISLAGPRVFLTPEAAQAIGMAIYELATNALKYGALSNAVGHIKVAWTKTDDPEPTLTVLWTERGGPRIVIPKRTGFGNNVTGRIIETSLGATTKKRFDESGLTWKLVAPPSIFAHGHDDAN